MLSAEASPIDTSSITMFSKDGSSLTFFQADSTSQTGEHIRGYLPDFCGANLVVAVIGEVN